MTARSTITRLLATFLILGVGWYTIQIYADLFSKISARNTVQAVNNNKETEIKLQIAELDEKELEEANEEWKKQQSLFQPVVKKLNRNPCFSEAPCSNDQFNFKLITGAANAIGPSICFNGTIIMKNSLNNVDRGMNVVIVDGKTGHVDGHKVFDLFDKDSTELKNFIINLKEDQIILLATADDAAHKLDDEARELLASIGSKHSKDLSFRDNWVFVGGKRIKKPTEFEKLIKSDKNTNKYGEWPEAITLEGCISRLT